MKIWYTPDFYKMYKKLDVRIRNRFDQKIEIFLKNPYEPILDNHELKDEWEEHRSINVTGDFRAIFYEEVVGDEIVANFVAIGTHDQLYKPKN